MRQGGPQCCAPGPAPGGGELRPAWTAAPWGRRVSSRWCLLSQRSDSQTSSRGCCRVPRGSPGRERVTGAGPAAWCPPRCSLSASRPLRPRGVGPRRAVTGDSGQHPSARAHGAGPQGAGGLCRPEKIGVKPLLVKALRGRRGRRRWASAPGSSRRPSPSGLVTGAGLQGGTCLQGWPPGWVGGGLGSLSVGSLPDSVPPPRARLEPASGARGPRGPAAPSVPAAGSILGR